MLFTTVEFVVFLAIAVAMYYILPKKLQWIVLLTASVLFYMSLGRRRVIIVIISALTTWAAAVVLQKFNDKEAEKLKVDKEKLTKEEKNNIKAHFKSRKRVILFCFLAINLSLLGFFKFYNLSTDYITVLPKLNLIMPVGISFYTLQIISYVMDVYNKKSIAEKNPFKTILFTTYFPQIIQGPISRFDKLSVQLTSEKSFNYDSFVLGLLRMLWGYFKKLVIADRFAFVVAEAFSNSEKYVGFEIWIVVFFYTIQLYADFSGGVDIALGASSLFGITLPENFLRPFFSKSISEFWRRWHITLGSWLKDYVFYPVTLSKPLARLGKWLNKNVSRWASRWIPAYISLFILWLCSGIWHGEGGQFIMYGLYHGTLIMLGMTFEPVFVRLSSRLSIDRQSESFKIFSVARTFFLIMIGELIFRSSSIAQSVSMLKAGFSAFNPWVLFDGFIFTLSIDPKDYYVGLVAIAILLAVSLLNRKQSMTLWVKNQELPIRWAIILSAIFIIVVFGIYGPGYDAVPFIYYTF